jgi:hypothetical protein
MRRTALALVVVIVATTGLHAEPLRRLRNSRARALAELAPVGRAPGDLPLDAVTVVLGLRHRRELEAIVAAQGDRRSPRFGKWLDAVEIADRFAPRRAEYEAVRRWFVARGFRVVRDSPFRLTLVVAGTAAQAEAALGTPIALYRRSGRVHHGPLAEPALPASIAASVRGIVGLDDFPKFHPLAQLTDSDGQPVTALAPGDFALAYDAAGLQAAGVTGAGRSIAVVARSNFADSDIATFSSQFHVALSPTRVFTGNVDPGILADQGEQIEVLLDTQWAGSLASGAALNVMIGSPRGNVTEALEVAIGNRSQGLPSGDVISVSFGLCELLAEPVVTDLFDYLYTVANAQGQTVVVASGDSGARDCLPQRVDLAVNALASSPHAVAIGGTSFALDANGDVPPGVPGEATWNDGFGAGGGGRSVVLAMPDFQVSAGLGAFGSGRVLPDVSLAASPKTPGYFIVQDATDRVVGGTSAGVPAFASTLALVNEHVATTRGTTGGLGQLLPTLYRLGAAQLAGTGPAVFRDVTTGDNQAFSARPGFDLATGWGAPLVGVLADALGNGLGAPGPCEPLIDAADPAGGCLVPSGRGRTACGGEWLVEQSRFAVDRRLPAVTQTCHDGDPECDRDAIGGHCTIDVALCVNVFDFRLLKPHGSSRRFPFRCNPKTTRRVRLLSPSARTTDPTLAANRQTLLGALAGLPLPTGLTNACTATVPVVVPVGGRLPIRARVSGRPPTTARLTLACE